MIIIPTGLSYMFWVKHYFLDKTPGRVIFQEKPSWPTSCSCVVRAAAKGDWQKMWKKKKKKKKKEKLQNFWSDSLFFLKIGNVKLWPFMNNSVLRIPWALHHNGFQQSCAVGRLSCGSSSTRPQEPVFRAGDTQADQEGCSWWSTGSCLSLSRPGLHKGVKMLCHQDRKLLLEEEQGDVSRVMTSCW